MTRQIVLASSNPGKLREFRALLTALDFVVIAQDELGIDAAEEPHLTFVENALAKARHAAARSGLPALADDSGLCVAALDGAPGVRSARFPARPQTITRTMPNCYAACRNSRIGVPTTPACWWPLPPRTIRSRSLPMLGGLERSCASRGAPGVSVTTRSFFFLNCAAPQPNSRRRKRTESVTEARRCASWCVGLRRGHR